jgi:hypothetical protein
MIRLGYDDAGDPAYIEDHEHEFIERVRAAWAVDVVPAVRRWQAEVARTTGDAEIVDVDFDDEDPRAPAWTFHLRSGASRRFRFDLIPKRIH